MTVFLLWHSHELNGVDDEKLIGVYASHHDALKAEERVRHQPGFRDTLEGFEIAEYVVGRDGWTEGFVTDS